MSLTFFVLFGVILICMSVFGGVRDAAGRWMGIGEKSGLPGADDASPV